MFNAVRLIGLMLVLTAVASPALSGADHSRDDVLALARQIDQMIARQWASEGVTPAPMADDAEFMRRVSLDICGKIPPAADVRDFLNDTSTDKRERLVERLLNSPAYVIHFTNLWRAMMIPEADADQRIRSALPGFEAWLRSRIAENRNFAQIVEEILTLPVTDNDIASGMRPESPTPAAFYLAKEGQPERLAAATARLFLGIRIDCAQCHDHPFDRWKQEQFWQHAAFFTDIQQSRNMVAAPTGEPAMIDIPEQDRKVPATFLDGQQPDWQQAGGSRALLARWIISDNNPYFARAAVNRIWSNFFGTGLVEPMDDFSPLNPASHPELLALLADEFIRHDYDFRLMIRAITATRTYQLTSRQTDPSQSEPRLFARMAVRGMTPEQIFDSLAQATGYRQPFDPEQPLNFNNDPIRQDFIATFSNRSESAPNRTSTILQALSLMNGQFIADATDVADSQTLTAVSDAPFLDTPEKIEALYLSTLTRKPGARELSRFTAYVDEGGATGDAHAALADVFWALLNSSEFLLNH